jgi:Flp pilus assembly protein TadG
MPLVRSRGRRDPARHPAPRGQALVEFALVLLLLMLVVMGIIQFGLMLNANVTLTNAAREGGRAGSIYIYRADISKDANDQNRCTAVLSAATQAFGLLTASSPNFAASNPCPAGSGDTWTNGDLTITYVRPSGVAVADSREAYNMTVRIQYKQDMIVPLIGGLLSRDGNGRFVHTVQITMVIN